MDKSKSNWDPICPSQTRDYQAPNDELFAAKLEQDERERLAIRGVHREWIAIATLAAVAAVAITISWLLP